MFVNDKIPNEMRNQAGFTLIELMVGLLISTVLVYFLFSTQSRMSSAFRRQHASANVISTVRAAKQHLIEEIQMAGHGIPTGVVGMSRVFTQVPRGNELDPSNPQGNSVGAIAVFQEPDEVNGDGGTPWGTDLIKIVYGDLNRSSRQVSSIQLGLDLNGLVSVNKSTIEIVGQNDLVTGAVESHDFQAPTGTEGGSVVILASREHSCILEITSIVEDPTTGNDKITFDDLGSNSQLSVDVASPTPHNYLDNDHCADVAADLSGTVPVRLMHARTRVYRINVTDLPGQGILQMSPKYDHQAVGDWTNLGIGFTNLQLAVEFSDTTQTPPVNTWASDTELHTNWWNTLETKLPTRVSLAIEVKSPFGTRGTVALATPAYGEFGVESDLGNAGQPCPNNTLYNPCGIDLQNTPDASRPTRYRGENIFRSSVTKVDLRNIGLPL